MTTTDPTPADEERGEYEKDPYYERDDYAERDADRYENALFQD